MDGWMDRRMDGLIKMDGWMDEWMDGWRDEVVIEAHFRD